MRITRFRASSPLVVLGILLLATTGCGSTSAPISSPSPKPDKTFAKVGDCVTFTDGGTARALISCDQEHVDEVFHEVAYDSKKAKDLAVISEAEQQCIGEAFTAFIGRPHSESQLLVTVIHADGDDVRAAEGSLLCTVSLAEGMVAGTLKGADR